jgi:hypothetical protein
MAEHQYQCQCLTIKGSQCRNNAVSNGLCHVHLNKCAKRISTGSIPDISRAEKDLRQRVEKELRQKAERQNKQHAEKDLRQRVEKELRQRAERQNKQRLEKDLRQRAEKELRRVTESESDDLTQFESTAREIETARKNTRDPETFKFIINGHFRRVIQWFRVKFPKESISGHRFWSLPPLKPSASSWMSVPRMDLIYYLYNEFSLHYFLLDNDFDDLVRKPRFEDDRDLHVKPDDICYPDMRSSQNLMVDYKLPDVNITCWSLDRMLTDPYWIDTFQSIGRRERENLGHRIYYHGLCAEYGIGFDLMWLFLRKKGYSLDQNLLALRSPNKNFDESPTIRSFDQFENYDISNFGATILAGGIDLFEKHRPVAPLSYFVGSYWLQEDKLCGSGLILRPMALMFGLNYDKMIVQVKQLIESIPMIKRVGSLLQIIIPDSVAQTYVLGYTGGYAKESVRFDDPKVEQVRILVHPKAFLDTHSGVKVYRYESDPNIHQFVHSHDYWQQLEKIINSV